MWLLWNLFDLAGTLSLLFPVPLWVLSNGWIFWHFRSCHPDGSRRRYDSRCLVRSYSSGSTAQSCSHRTGPIGCYCNQLLYLFVPFGGPEKKFLNLLYIAADTIGLASFTVTGTMVGLSDGEPESYIFLLS